MSAKENNVDAKVEIQEQPQRSALDELEDERNGKKTVEPEKEEKAKQAEKDAPESKVTKETKPAESKSPAEKKEKSAETVKKALPKDEDDEDEDLRTAETEKLKKALNDSQKWGHTNNRRLKNAVKMINSLKDSGTLEDDDFSKLHDLLHSDSDEEPEQNITLSESPISNLLQIANQRVTDLEEIYDHDELFRKKLSAFDFLIQNSSEEEIEDIADELEEFKNNPLKLVKKMYMMGENYYNEIYKDLDEAGGLKQFVYEKNEEIKRLRKKLDKLEKKRLESSDYDESTNFKIDELGDTDKATKQKPGSVLDQLEEEQEASYKRARGR